MDNLFLSMEPGHVRPASPYSRRGTFFHLVARTLGLLLLMNLACALNARPKTRPNSFSFNATMVNGTRVHFTLTPTEPAHGTIREIRWNKEKNPVKDTPDYDLTTTLYNIRASRDGTKVVCKAAVPLKNPDVMFLVKGLATEQTVSSNVKGPTVEEIVKGSPLGLRDGTTVYSVSRKDCQALLDFIRRVNFPPLE